MELPVSGCERWRVEHPENSVWNGRPSRCFRRVGTLARGAFKCFTSALVAKLLQAEPAVLAEKSQIREPSQSVRSGAYTTPTP